MATYNNIKKIKIGDNIFNLYDSGNSGGTITSVKTTAGAHTAVNVTSGAVSFNVPTKTSDLTNDSGFLTSHQTITKAMVTTALGTGSGTTKFLREDGSWATPAYIANTDAKLQVAEVTSATQYYPLVGTGTTAATRQYDTTGFKYKGTTGTTSAVGSATVELGNSTASGTAGNKQAQLIMYGSNAKKATITLAAPSADIALALPTSGGTLALTSQIPTVSYPVTSVNSKTGAVSLTASDVGALASNTTYVSKITTTAGAHTAISNKSGAVSFNVPTKTSHLTNDSGFITSYTDTKVTQTSLNGTNSAKNVLMGYNLNDESTNIVYKSTYMTYNDYVPSLTLTNKNDSTYHMSVSHDGFHITTGSYIVNFGAITQTNNHIINLPDKSGTIALTSDIPTTLPASDVSAWAKAATKPSYTASEVGAVPTTRTINDKALSSDISLVPSDIGAAAASAIPEVSTVISVNVTTSTGQYVDSVCRKYGRVVQLAVGVRNTSAVASGSNFYLGTFNSALPAPIMITTSATYYGKHPVTAALNAGRELTIRNTSTSSVTIGSSSTLYVTLTYLTTD